MAPKEDWFAEPLWPWLCLKIREASRDWIQGMPEHSCLAVFPLDLLAELLVSPDCAAALQTQHILSQPELARLSSFSHQKRRLQWLGGRLAAKYALQQAILPGVPENLPASLVIENDRHGSPLLQVSDRRMEACVSISHSGRLAAAMAARSPCGLDIQEMVPRLQPLQSRFASAAELALGTERYDTLGWLGMLWAAKEAVKKCRYADQATFMERTEVVTHTGWATGPRGAILRCRLQDTQSIVPVRVIVRQGYAMAVDRGENRA